MNGRITRTVTRDTNKFEFHTSIIILIYTKIVNVVQFFVGALMRNAYDDVIRTIDLVSGQSSGNACVCICVFIDSFLLVCRHFCNLCHLTGISNSYRVLRRVCKDLILGMRQ